MYIGKDNGKKHLQIKFSRQHDKEIKMATILYQEPKMYNCTQY